MAELKRVVWTITNATIIPGVANAKGDQVIFKIAGVLKRSDSTTTQKGPFLWTENKRKAGYVIDVSRFDRDKGTGTITIAGEIVKNGRKQKAAAVGDALSAFTDLHFDTSDKS